MDKLDVNFEWAFGLNRFTLILFGVWPINNNYNTYGKLKVLLTPLIVFIIVFGLFLPQMYALSKVYRELPLLIDNLTAGLAVITASVKLLLLWYNQEVLEPIQKSIIADWHCQRHFWEQKVMIKHAQRARILTISCYCVNVLAACGFLALPVLGLRIRIINNITDPVNHRVLPLQAYYPYDSIKSPNYELTYMSQMIAGSLVAVTFNVPDVFFGALIFHVCAQCEILGIKMSRLLRKDRNHREKLFFRLTLKRLVDTHVHLIKFVNGVERSFNILILAEVLCVSLVICCAGFGVITKIGKEGEHPPLVQILALTGTLMDLMIHMFAYCMASEILIKHSSSIFHAIYCSNWLSLPGKFSRDITLIMVRSKYPLRITAGKFISLSLHSYLSILKSSAGYISMLLAVNN